MKTFVKTLNSVGVVRWLEDSKVNFGESLYQNVHFALNIDEKACHLRNTFNNTKCQYVDFAENQNSKHWNIGSHRCR